MKKKFITIALVLIVAVLAIANGPPTDPDGEVVFAPWKPTGPVRITTDPNPPEGGALLNSGGGYAYCDVGAGIPALEPGQIVHGAATIDCEGDWQQTKVQGTLQRHKWGPWWVNLNKRTLGWYAAPSFELTCTAPASRANTPIGRSQTDGCSMGTVRSPTASPLAVGRDSSANNLQ